MPIVPYAEHTMILTERDSVRSGRDGVILGRLLGELVRRRWFTTTLVFLFLTYNYFESVLARADRYLYGNWFMLGLSLGSHCGSSKVM